jgi:hypothetical protein
MPQVTGAGSSCRRDGKAFVAEHANWLRGMIPAQQ